MMHDLIQRLLPSALFNMGPQGLMWWQWLAFPVLAAVAWAIGRPLGATTRGILRRLFRRTQTKWDDRLLARIGAALTMLWALAAFRLLLPVLELQPEASRFVHRILAATAVVTTFWALWRSITVLIEMLLERPWAADNASARSLLTVAGNLVRAAIVAVGVVSTIAAFGYPVATILAGLGIGGIAFAFGAQKTVENLFGSVALATDQPFRVGDFVKIEEFVGTIERIGTRSTRIRTLDRTLITIPNGRLSDMRIETFAARDRIRFTTTIGLVYETTQAQMARVIEGFEQALRAHPKIWQDTVVVRFAGFGASSLDIEIMCWFETIDYNEFRDCRQQALFEFMRVVEQVGTSFAFPTQTLHVASLPAPVRS
jgi:MscS family membrane protein